MKLTLFPLCALLLVPVLNLPAQTQSSATKRYVVIDYMKALPGQAPDALRLEREMWQPVHQERVSTGKIDFWRVYTCAFPSGSENEYDYVTITQYPSFAQLDDPYSSITPETLARILPSFRPGELVTRTEAVRKLVREDVLPLEMSTSGWPGATVGVLNVGFLKIQPGKAAAFAQIQRDHFLPLMDEMAKANAAASWAYTPLRFPLSDANPYDVVSFGGYASLAQMEAAPTKTPEPFRAKEREVAVLLNAARTRVRNQLWLFQTGTQPK